MRGYRKHDDTDKCTAGMPEPRDRVLMVRLSTSEREVWRRAAKREGVSTSEWVRIVAHRAVEAEADE